MGLFSRFGSQKESSTTSPRSLYAIDIEDDDQLVSFLEGRWKTRAFARQNLERQWYLNIAYYLSFQWHSFDTVTGALVTPPRRKGQVRIVGNKIQPGVRKYIAKGMKMKPQWAVIPATSDDEDVVKSQLSTKVLKYYWRWLVMDEQLMEFLLWIATTGNAFIRAWWDPTKGPEMRFTDEELASIGDMGKKFMGQAINMGDVQVSVRSPFAIDIDDAASSMRDLCWLIDSSSYQIERLEEKYGKRAQGMVPNSKAADNLTQFYQRKIHDLAGGAGLGGFASGTDDGDDQVIGHELWVNPTKKYPKGYYCFAAGGKILERRAELPNPKRQIPYFFAGQIPVPGRFWHTCAVEHVIPLQSAYNKGRSQMIQAQNQCAKPKVLEPREAKLLDSAFTDEAGERIKYRGGYKPEYMQLQPLPEYVHKNLDYHLRDIEDILAVHEVTQSRAPSSVRSGTAVNYLQEQDEQTQAPSFLMVERGFSGLGSLILELAAENISEQRLIKIVGEDRSVDSFTFTGRDLYGPNKELTGVNYFDVETQMGSQLPHSRQQREQFAINLVQAGILDRVADRKKIHQILDLGSEEPALNADQLDRQNARGEQKLMMAGFDVEVHPEDNPEIHMEEHIRWMKSAEFRRQEEQDPELRARAERHNMMHQGMLQSMAPAEEAPPGPEEAAPPQPMEAA